MRLFDTHSHFDFPVFDADRVQLAQAAYQQGVADILIAGYVARDFSRLVAARQQLDAADNTPTIHVAAGLHPAFVAQHHENELAVLQEFLATQQCVALGEIGLDTFTTELKQPDVFRRQQQFFSAQLDMAAQTKTPVILHIRKSHADVLKMLKASAFHQGGIAHSFSGGVQEAKAFVELGFKLGMTGQVCNPNAKKLRSVVQAVGAEHLVIETDCPDMLPYQLYQQGGVNRNEPANLVYVLEALSDLLNRDKQELAEQLWNNSCQVILKRND